MTDFTHLSSRNTFYKKAKIIVANGAEFESLELSKEEKNKASNVLYLHVHRETKQCYIGITEQEAGKRWFSGIAYTNNRRFGNAIRKYGWDQFDSYILAFAEDREALNQAEIEAIVQAGGHKSKYTYNLSPGGDMVAENDKPIVGVFLETGETRNFKSGSAAARLLGMKNTDMPMAVARGERSSVQGWWFRLEEDAHKEPPKVWGDELRVQAVRAVQSKNIIAIHYETKEERQYATLEDAATNLGVTKGLISMVARGDSSSANGWWLKYEGSKRTMPKSYGSALRREKRDETVYAFNLESGERREFRNCTVADTELNIYKGAAASVASKERTSAAGWWFSLDKNESPPTKFKGALVAEARSKPIIAIELATGKETRFASAKEAEESLKVHRSTISNIIKGKAKPSKGFTFKFA
jgi:hypothetical protein